MSMTGLEAFDSTIQQTNIWLKDIMTLEGWQDRHKAYKALRTVLHVLRDRLPVSEAVDLGAELPMLVRGIYYDGWQPSKSPIKRGEADFFSYVSNSFNNDRYIDPEEIIKAVFSVISCHVSAGEVKHIKDILPEEIRHLWPQD